MAAAIYLSVPSRIFLISLGSAVPALLLGRVVLAAFIFIAVAAGTTLHPPRFFIQTLKRAISKPVGILVISTLICWTFNIWVSPLPFQSLEGVVRLPIFLSIAVLFWGILRNDNQAHELLLKVLICTSVFSLILALLSLVILPEVFWLLRLKGWQDFPVDNALKPFGALSTLIVPVLLWAGHRLGALWLVLSAVATALFLVLIGLTYNKAPVAGLLGSAFGVTLALLIRRESRRWAFLALILVLISIGVVILWIYDSRFWLVALVPQGDWFFPLWLVDFQRQSIWAHTLSLVPNSLWIGFGVNAINYSPGADAIIPGTSDLNLIPAHPHNWAVEVLSETGIIGFLPFLAAISWMMIDLLANFRRTGDLAMLAGIAVSLGYWSSGLFNFSFWSAWWQVSFFLMTSFCLAGCKKSYE